MKIRDLPSALLDAASSALITVGAFDHYPIGLVCMAASYYCAAYSESETAALGALVCGFGAVLFMWEIRWLVVTILAVGALVSWLPHV